MATFKATKYKNVSGSTFKATKKKSYDTTMAYTWESKNKESASKLNDYSSRVNDGGFLSADDLTDYKKSLDSYVDSSRRLRDLSLSLGKTYTDEENAEWDKQLASLNTLYDQARDYYSQWENEEAYNQAVESQKAYENTLAMDLPSAWEEVASLEKELSDYESWKYLSPTEEVAAKYRQFGAKYGSAGDLEKMIAERRAYLNQVQRTQEGAKMAAVADPESELYDPDFAKYSGYSSTKQDGFFEKMSSKYGMGYGDLVYEYINGANNGMRQDILSSATAWNADNRLHEQGKYTIYDEMTPEQVSIYNYYYAKEGKEAADKYLENIAETLSFSKAQKAFANLQGKPVAEVLYGFVAGAEQANQGLKNFFSSKDYIPTTSGQYLSGMVREDLGGVGQFFYDINSTVANMAPSILSSAVIGQLNPTAGVIAGNAMMGASSVGNAYQQALSMGYNKTQSRVYSTMVGAAEVGMQYALGGIGKLGGKLSGKAIQMLNGIDNAIFRVAGKVGASAVSEGLEEGLTEIVDTWIGNMVLHMDEDINWDEVAYSTLLGAVSGGVMNVGDIAKSESTIQKQGQVIENAKLEKTDVDAFIQEGLAAPKDSEAYQIAEHLQQKQASGKDISGQELARLQMENERVIQAEEAKTNSASNSSGLNLAKQVIAGDLGENGNKLMERVYREAEDAGIDTSKTDFARGFLSYYNAGFTDNSVENVKWKGQGLTDLQKTALWKAGRQDAIASLQKAQKGKFVVYGGKNAGLVKNQYSDALQKTNPGVFVAADKLGKQLGTRVEIKPLEDGVNGNIQDGVVTLNSKLLGKQNVEEVFLGTLAHEAFHRMMEVAPTEARAFRDYVAKVYASRGSLEGTVSTYIQGYSGKQSLTNEGALEEAAADYIKKFVKDTKLFSDAMKQPENQSWGRKFVESVKALIAKIKKVFTDQDARNAASIEATGKNLSEVEQAVKIWEKALGATTEGVKTSDRRISPKQAQKNTAENGGGKNSLVVVNGKYYEPSFIEISSKHPEIFVAHILDAKYEPGVALSDAEYNAYRRSQEAEARKAFGEYTNRDTAYSSEYGKIKAEFGAKAVRKGKSYGGVALFDILPHIGEIFEKAVVVRTKADRANDVNIRGIVELVGGAILGDNNLAVVKLNVIEYASNEAKIYDNRVIEIEELTVVGGIQNQIGTEKSPAVSSKYILDAYHDFVNKKYSIDIDESQANEEKALQYFGRTYSWKETGYLTRSGKKLDFSGKHEGGPGGYRSVDHRDIADAMGEDYGDGSYSGGMVQFMREGNIRISPESGGINLSVMPTKAQLNALDDFISRERGEVILDLDDENGNTLSSTEYPRGTRASKVISDIRNYFETGEYPQVSEVSQYRYSMEGTENIEEQVRRERLQRATEAYSDIPKGEKPARDVTVPRAVSQGKHVSYTIRTALEAGVTPESMVPKIQEKILAETFSDVRLKNKDLVASANEWVRDFSSTQKALEEWLREGGKQIGPEATARGYVLYNQLATESARAETVELQEQYAKQAIDVLTDIVNTTREAARTVQATRILKNMSPEGQFYSLQRAVEQLNRKLDADAAGFKLEKGREKLEIDQEIATKWMRALHEGDQKKAAAYQEMLYKSIAQQVERNFYDKWTAWRYLSMLGNPKTIIRNLAGNLAMAPMQYTKNKIAAGLEAMVIKDQSQRTKSFSTRNSQQGRDLEAFAREDYAVAAEMLEDPGKYKDKDRAALRQAIWDYKKTFQAKWLHKWQEVTDAAMNNDVFGDKGFMMRYYSTAFAQAAQARGFTAEQIKSGVVSQAQIDSLRAYAFRQAQRATFRDLNAFSMAISKLRIPDKYGRAATVANRVLEGFLPFRVTPANVTVRAVEYSPVGLVMNTITGLIDVKRGNITAAEAIDKIASGLTGTGVYLLGAMLAGMGALTGGELDDDEKRKGFQAYSLVIGGNSYTLDWLAPAAIPLFMGAESYNCIFEPLSRGENTGLGEIYQSVASSFQPLLEMSCLSGVNSLLDSLSYADGADFGQVAYSMFVAPFLSYVSQGIPTLSSQTANLTEAFSEKTYTGDIVNSFERNLIYDLARIAEKLPFADWRQVPRVDGWGRTEDGTSAWESYLSPGYFSQIEVTKADEEIDRLKIAIQEQIDGLNKRYEQVQTLSAKAEIKAEISKLQSLMNVSPDLASTKINKVPLTQEEYTTYALEKGENNYMLATAVMGADWYAELDDRYKAKALKLAYEVADARGKWAAVSFADDGEWTYDYLEADTERVLRQILVKVKNSISADKREAAKKKK